MLLRNIFLTVAAHLQPGILILSCNFLRPSHALIDLARNGPRKRNENTLPTEQTEKGSPEEIVY